MQNVNILGLGPSANLWRSGEAYTIGVNDSWKYGPTERLVVVNKFDPETEFERCKTITNSRPVDGLWSCVPQWESHPSFKQLPYLHFFFPDERYRKDYLYRTGVSSAFVAVTMAVNMGAEKVTLFGVDFEGHKVIKGGYLTAEIENFKKLAESLLKLGIVLQLASQYGALANFLPTRK